MRVFIKALFLSATLAVSTISTSNAANVYIDYDAGITYVGMLATHSGGYRYTWNGFSGSLGDHVPSSTVVSDYMNNYFVFDLNVLTPAGIDLSTLTHAKLELSAGSYFVPTDDFSYSVFDISTNVNELIATQKDRTDIFQDLQSGVKYGSLKLPYYTDQLTGFTVNFNIDGINALKSSNGLFAVGGSFNQRLDGEYDTAYMMPNDGAYALYLQFATPVPEPETYGMLLVGLGMLAGTARVRQK